MRYVILVRHGVYFDVNLHPKGRDQITDLAWPLRNYTTDGQSLILASPLARTVQSAEILAKLLRVPFDTHEVLQSCEGRKKNLDTLHAVVKTLASMETLILVTHGDYCNEYPVYFMKKEFGIQCFEQEVSLGQACVVDCERKVRIPIRD